MTSEDPETRMEKLQELAMGDRYARNLIVGLIDAAERPNFLECRKLRNGAEGWSGGVRFCLDSICRSVN